MITKDIAKGIFHKALVISVILLLMLSLAIMPTPDSVVRGATKVDMELEAGWNFVGLPESTPASDLALKSKKISSVVRMGFDGYYVSYIPSLGITDFICEPNEAIYIYSITATIITFTIKESAGDISGDLYVIGDTILNKNLTVNGSMSVVGDFEVNSLNVTEDLTVDGDLTVNENLVVGEDLTVSGNLIVGEDLTVGDLTVTEDMTINDDLSVVGDAIIDGDSTVRRDITIDGNLSVAGDSTVGGDSIVGGDMEIGKNLSVTGDTIIGGDAIIVGNLTAGDFIVDTLTISEDLSISGNLSVAEDTIIGGDAIITGSLTAGDFTVDTLTIAEDLSINGNLSIAGDTTIGGDAIIGGNLTAGDFTVETLMITDDLSINGNLTVAGDSTIGGDSSVAGDMAIDGNLTVNGALLVDKDVQVDGNLSVIQDTTIGGYLTVTGNATFEQDLTVNGNLTVYNLVSNIVSENYVVGNLTVTENAIGLPFTDEPDYTIFINGGVIYAKNGNTGEIEFQSTDASLVFNPVIQNVISRGYGGKIFFKAGRYNFSEALIIEGVTEAEGTITIEGSGYWRATKLYLMSPTILPTFVSLKGSRFLQLRNLQLMVNKKADYGIRMERDATGQPAGDHVLENVYITNARKVGLLSYGSENLHLENVYARYGNPIGMMITGFPPVADPTVIGAMPVNLSGTPRSTLQITMINCKWGEAGTTTRAGLIIYRGQVSILGGLSMVRQDAEANFIIDENLNHGLISGAIIDMGPACAFKIGAYPSAAHRNSHLTIQGVNAREMNGTNIVHAQYMVGSSIMGLMTNQDDGKIILETTTARNLISGFINYSITSEYLQVIDNGVGNIVLQDIMYMNATVSVGHNLRVGGDISVIGDLSVGGSLSYDDLSITGDLTVGGDIIGATGRSADFLVAANNAPQWWKNQADYQCDGTDDQVEINVAFENCTTGTGYVVLSPGTFTISDTIIIPYGVMLEGQGIRQTKIDSSGSAEAIFWNEADVAQNIARGGGIKNLYIDCNNANTIGLRIRSAWWCFVEGVEIRYATNHGLQVESSYGVYIDGVNIHECGGNGINFCEYDGETNTGVRVVNAEICNNGKYNIGVTNGAHLTLDKIWFENGAGKGNITHLFIDDNETYVPRVWVSDCTFGNLADGTLGCLIQGGMVYMKQNYMHGGGALNESALRITDGYLHFENNHVFNWGNSGNGGQGIDIDGCTWALIQENTFDGMSNSGYSVHISGGTSINIDNNRFSHGGIYTSANYVKITNNYFIDITDDETACIFLDSDNNDVQDNYFFALQHHGIYSDTSKTRNKIIGNTLINIGLKTANTYDGIYITGYGHTVENNKLYNPSAIKMRYGIHASSVSWTKVNYNYIEGATTSDIYFTGINTNCEVIGNSVLDKTIISPVGAGCIVKDNVGYVHLDNDYIVAPSGSVEFADFYCDGINDEVEIQYAIDNCTNGGTVLLLNGIYSVRQVHLRSNVRLIGQGWGTILRLPDHVTDSQAEENGNHGGSVIGTEIAGGNVHNASVENLQIDGNKANQDVTVSWAGRYGFMGVLFDNIDYGFIKNCYIHNCHSAGVYVEPVGGTAYCNQIIGNTVENCGSDIVAFGGIYTEVAYYTIIENNIVKDSYNHGIRADRSTTVTDNYVEGSSIGAGIYVDGDYNTISVNSVVDANIKLMGASYNIVSNNNCTDDITLIRLSAGNGAEFNTIEGNSISRLILKYEADNNIVVGNTICGGQYHGIALESASNNTVSNNIIMGNGQLTDNSYDGIHLAGGTAGANNNYIYGNTIRHLDGTNQHRYGIYVSALFHIQIGNIVKFNDLRDSGKTASIRNDGVGTVIFDNLGYVSPDNDYIVAPSGSVTNADFYCDGIDDQVQIQNAIDSCTTHGIVTLLPGEYSCSNTITAKSGVNVFGHGAFITLHSDSDIHGITFNNIINSRWEGIRLNRTGNPSGIVHVGYIIGTSDDSCRIINCVFDNQATAGSASAGLLIGGTATPYCDNVKGYGATVSTHSYGIAIYTSASPTLYNCYGEAYSSATNGYGIYLFCIDGSPKLYNCKGVSTLAIGIFTIYCVDYETELHNCEGIGLYGIQIASESSPTLIGCIGRGNSQDISYGYAITDQAEPVLEGCVGYGGTGINGHGFYLPDSVTPTMMNCVGYAGDGTGSIGIYMLTSASPMIIGGKFVAGNVSSSKAVKLSQTASPKITNTVFTNHETSHSWEYDDADSGRFRPYGGANYQLITISIHVQVENVGVTVDLGTTPGGNQIADDIDISSYGGTSVNYVRVSRSSDAYMYATVSSPVGDGDFVVYYAVMNDNSGWTADLETAGYPQFTDCQFYGGVYGLPMYIQGDSVTYHNFRFINCLFENYDTTYSAISASGEIDATGHFIDCVFRGTITNIMNLFETEVDYFNDVQAGTQNYIVSNEDLTGATPITCTISNQPDVPRNINFTINDLDTSITAFTIFVYGMDARGNSMSESFTFSGGLIQTGNIAFATISSIQVSDITGASLGDVLNVGIGTKLGLSSSIEESGDVYKVKKNTADYPLSSYTVNTVYDTVDVSTGGMIASGDDFTIWYKTD